MSTPNSMSIWSVRWRMVVASLLALVLLIGLPLLSQSKASAQETTPATAISSDQNSEPKTYDDLRRSTVLIVVTWSVTMAPPQSSTPPQQPSMFSISTPLKPLHATVQGFCTGWFAGPNGQIVSAGHCFDIKAAKNDLLSQINNPPVNPFDPPSAVPTTPQSRVTLADLPDPDLRLQVMQPSDLPGIVVKQPTDAHLVASLPFEQGDYGLIKVDSLSSTPALPIALSMPADGSMVRSIGFSGNLLESTLSPEVQIDFDNPAFNVYSDDPARLAQDVSHTRFRASVKTGTLDGEQFPMGTLYKETGAALTPGMSGGPTVFQRPDGVYEVVGGNDFITDFQAFNFVSALQGMNDFLADHGMNPVRVAISNASDNTVIWSFQPWQVIGGGIVIALLVGLIVWLLNRERKVKVASESDGITPVETTEKPNTPLEP